MLFPVGDLGSHVRHARNCKVLNKGPEEVDDEASTQLRTQQQEHNDGLEARIVNIQAQFQRAIDTLQGQVENTRADIE